MGSRFDFDGGDEGGMPSALWWATIRRAQNSPRGQKFLAELEEALLALPAKRLISGAVIEDGEVCAIGSLLLHRANQGRLQLKEGKGNPRRSVLTEDLEETFRYIDNEWDMYDLATRIEQARTLVWRIAYANDEQCSTRATPEERYEHVLQIVRQMRQGQEALGYRYGAVAT